jgi:CxxC-x17-CxxC domain-containing protein
MHACMGKKVLIGSFSSALAHGMVSVSDGVIDLDAHVAEISQKIYQYICTKCGNKFELPFKLFANQTPYCKDCIKSH